MQTDRRVRPPVRSIGSRAQALCRDRLGASPQLGNQLSAANTSIPCSDVAQQSRIMTWSLHVNALVSRASMTETSPSVTLTPAGTARGIATGLPMLGSGFVYGLAFGTLAASAGLSFIESVLMSVLVFSGTAQIAVVQIWSSQPSALAAGVIVLIANVRYVLLSASLRPWLGGLPAWKAALPLTFLVDGAYAAGMRAKATGATDAGALLGPSLASFTGWVTATALGYLSGQLISNPRALGLDFVVIAFCVSAATMMTRNLRDLVPAIAAGFIVVLVDRLSPGPWTIIAAGITAVLVAAWRYKPEAAT
jgi:predicted branched-subunit amino acid permease